MYLRKESTNMTDKFCPNDTELLQQKWLLINLKDPFTSKTDNIQSQHPRNLSTNKNHRHKSRKAKNYGESQSESDYIQLEKKLAT